MKKVIKILLPIVSIILLVLGLFNVINFDTAISIALIINGISSILNGYYDYKKNKKREAIILILIGFIIIILVISTLILRNL